MYTLIKLTLIKLRFRDLQLHSHHSTLINHLAILSSFRYNPISLEIRFEVVLDQIYLSKIELIC